MADDLAAFLSARLDEDEAAAKGLAGSLERQNMGGWSSTIPGTVTGNTVTINTAWLPDRVLREVAAKRAILAAHEAVLADCHSVGLPARRPRKYGEYDGLRKAVAELAAVWSDHPDYRQEWAPAPTTISP
jgi:hypothetical protein